MDKNTQLKNHDKLIFIAYKTDTIQPYIFIYFPHYYLLVEKVYLFFKLKIYILKHTYYLIKVTN